MLAIDKRCQVSGLSGFGRQVFACPNLAAENWNILENYNIKTDSKFSLSISLKLPFGL